MNEDLKMRIRTLLGRLRGDARAVSFGAVTVLLREAVEAIDELECTLADEEAAHQDTLRLLKSERLAR